jgi:hypothetical protein
LSPNKHRARRDVPGMSREGGVARLSSRLKMVRDDPKRNSRHFFFRAGSKEAAKVPQGRLSLAQDAVLGRFRNMIESLKGRLKIIRLSAVPNGTVRAHNTYPGLRPGLHSAVPAGLSFRICGPKAVPFTKLVRSLIQSPLFTPF